VDDCLHAPPSICRSHVSDYESHVSWQDKPCLKRPNKCNTPATDTLACGAYHTIINCYLTHHQMQNLNQYRNLTASDATYVQSATLHQRPLMR
jgi:hypothetical protein